MNQNKIENKYHFTCRIKIIQPLLKKTSQKKLVQML